MASLSRWIGAVLLAVSAVAAAGPGQAAWRDDYESVRIGYLAGSDLAGSAARVDAFRAYLSDALGVPVTMVAAGSLADLIVDATGGRVQAAFLSATAFAAARILCGCVDALVVPSASDGALGVHALLLTLTGGPIAAVSDLSGHRLAIGDPDSIAGRLLPLHLFAAEGVPESAITLVPAINPVEATLALLRGEADAALGWSSLTGNQATGYNRGVLTTLNTLRPAGFETLNVLWVSPLIPYGPLAVRSDVPADLRAELADAMTRMVAIDRNALAAVDGGLGGGFRDAEASWFEPLIELITP